MKRAAAEDTAKDLLYQSGSKKGKFLAAYDPSLAKIPVDQDENSDSPSISNPATFFEPDSVPLDDSKADIIYKRLKSEASSQDAQNLYILPVHPP